MTEFARTWTTAVNDAIVATLEKTAKAVEPSGAAAHDLVPAIRIGSEGGKRLRATLVCASHQAHSGSAEIAAVGVASALELFQTAALLHDDVLDDSDTRRGKPAAHRTLAALHRDNDWEGSSQEFGNAGAILAGDIALMASHRALFSALVDLPAAQAARTAHLFSDMAELVTAGQHLDMRIAVQPLATLSEQEEDIRRTMRTKTATYSAEFPLALGASVAGATDDDIARIREVGVPLGVAFQLRDDVLGLTGSPAVTGKPAGDDIREGKRTLILWHAWRAASESQRSMMQSVLGARDASDEQVAAVVEVMENTGALEFAEAEISHLADTALDALHSLALEPQGVDALVAVFSAAIKRNA